MAIFVQKSTYYVQITSFASPLYHIYVFSLKSNGLSILILLELELIFLAALLLAPAVIYGLAFFSGVRYGYFLMLIILVSLAFYNYLFITKHIQKRENG